MFAGGMRKPPAIRLPRISLVCHRQVGKKPDMGNCGQAVYFYEEESQTMERGEVKQILMEGKKVRKMVKMKKKDFCQ